jgi:hypothetical protein
MKPQDIFADEMLRGPILVKPKLPVLLFVTEPNRSDVIR